MKADLTIRGRIDALHLEPGDRIIVTLDDHSLRASQTKELREQVKAAFPGHEVVIVAAGLRLAPERRKA